MTTFALPNEGYSAQQWRVIYRTPPDARFETVGTYCPLDDTLLRVRLDGWGCPVCAAAWDFKGLHGRWLPSAVDVLDVDAQTTDVPDVEADAAATVRLRRLDQRLAAGIGLGAVIGFGYSAGRAMDPHLEVPTDLVLMLAGLLAAAGAVTFGVLVLLGWLDARRYAGNEIVGPVELTAAEVPDGE